MDTSTPMRGAVLSRIRMASYRRNSALTIRRHCLTAMWDCMNITPNTRQRFKGAREMKLKDKRIEIQEVNMFLTSTGSAKSSLS